MDTNFKFPFYAKASLLLIGLYVFANILSIAQGIILPLIYATIIAISISPMVNFLVNKKVNHAVAIALVLTLTIVVIIALIVLLSSQASLLSDAMPQLTLKFQALFNDSLTWFSQYFNISEQKIKGWIANEKGELLNNSGSAIGTTLTTVGGVLSVTFLTPVYIFMILIYQAHLIEFIHRVFGAGNDNKVSDVLSKTKTIVQGYLVGLFTEFAIVAILNIICLKILGIDYAILFGILGALLNVIPYIGGLIAVILFMVIAFVTKSPVYALYVLVLYGIIQFTDNHYIVPKIIGSKVKLNALVCLIAVLIGSALWGIPGMFLTIPLTAIVKLIFDHIDSLKDWGFLMGDTTPPMIKFNLNFKDFANQLPRIMPPFRKK
jgi:predicted PurR-regulated permease PerM